MDGILPLALALLPVLLILVLLVGFRRPAHVSGLLGWAAAALVAWLAFRTAPEVVLRSTAAGLVKSFPVSLIVATSLLQMAFMERTGALRRIVVFLKTLSADDRAVQTMMLNIGFGTLMVAVGATPVSLLPPILLAMGYSTTVAIMMPAIGYDALCTYALLGAPIVVFVDLANAFLKANPIPGVGAVTLSQAGSIFYWFLPVVSTLIGLCMLWIGGRWKGVREGLVPVLVTGATIAGVAFVTNRIENLVVLTGVFCGLAVIGTMTLYLLVRGRKVIDRSRLTEEDRAVERSMPLWRAVSPWIVLIVAVLALNVPRPVFDYLYRTMVLAIPGVSADGAAIPTRALWNAYTWILFSVLASIPLMRPSRVQLRDTARTWWKRAPKPVFSAAVFFAVGEIMNMSGYDMVQRKFATASMVQVLADFSAGFFQKAYGAATAFIGLFGGFVTGSEASTIAMFAKYTLTTGQKLGLPIGAMIGVTAAMAFGGGLASVISPAKLQNAAAAIDRPGEENRVVRTAFVLSLGLTAVTAAFSALLQTWL